MRKGFSTINIIVFFCGITFVFLLYDRYYKPKPTDESLNKINTMSSSVTQSHLEPQKIAKPPRAATTSQETPTDDGGDPLPDLGTLPPVNQTMETKTDLNNPITPPQPTTKNGYYENTTYNYSLTCPTDWLLNVRSDDNVSIGTVPPRDGLGAITIEVTKENTSGEISAAEAQAKKYPGIISFKKSPITINGVIGEKTTMTNSLANTENIYIFLKKNNFYYLIKYSNESKQFTTAAEAALKTFKFTK